MALFRQKVIFSLNCPRFSHVDYLCSQKRGIFERKVDDKNDSKKAKMIPEFSRLEVGAVNPGEKANTCTYVCKKD